MNNNKTLRARSKKSIGALAVTALFALGAVQLWAQPSQWAQPAGSQADVAAPRLITAESLLDSEVYDNANRKIGEVENVFINPENGRIERVAIEFNLQAMDDRAYSLTWDQFNIIRRENGGFWLVVDQSVIDRVRQAIVIDSVRLNTAQIRDLQQRLNAEGYQAGEVSGQWNRQTQSALRNFQQSQGLQATGRLDEQTLHQMGLDTEDYRQTRR